MADEKKDAPAKDKTAAKRSGGKKSGAGRHDFRRPLLGRIGLVYLSEPAVPDRYGAYAGGDFSGQG